MKTFTNAMMAAAFALAGSTAMAQSAGQAGFGACPNGFCGTTAGCPDGKCGPLGCTDGSCGVGVPHRHVHSVGRPLGTVQPRSAAVGYGVPSNRPIYGTVPTAACPTGNCPRPAATPYGVGYRTSPVAANCPNGRCDTVPVPVRRQPTYQTPRVNFLGLNW